MAMKLEILSKEVIKPDSPNHLQTLHLSLFDQFLPKTYVSAIFFYDDHQPDQEEILVQKLKNSLSQTLSLFYPLAGRIKEGVTVDCNDEGALFTKARADVLLSDVLRNPSDAGLVHKLIVSMQIQEPGHCCMSMSFSSETVDSRLLLVPLTRYATRPRCRCLFAAGQRLRKGLLTP